MHNFPKPFLTNRPSDVPPAETTEESDSKQVREYIGQAQEGSSAALHFLYVRNATIDYLRAYRSIPCEEIRLYSEDRERIGRERRRDLEQALNRLPTEQRNVFVLRHIVGLSPVEIASLLGKTESSVHGLHHRGRLSMQSSLRQLGTVPVVA